jgi:hypothetical protein
MKTKPLFHCLRLLFAAALLVGTTHAQNTAVPDYLSYQGRALNADGTTIGSGTPVNRTVTFRVWDHPSNSLVANLIYSEQQVVTISNGEFSALIGAGAATTGTELGYSETSKGVPTVKISAPSVFGAATRYLGVTIDDGTAAVDNEISPRQQFVTSSYAFRAKVAESVDANAISSAMLATGAVGSNQLAAESVTSAKLGTSAVLSANIGDSNVTTGKIANLNVTTGKIANLNVTTAKIADLNVTTGKIDNNAVDNTKLRDSVGLSVIGRTGSTTGDPADIVAGTDGQVLRRAGTSVGFGTVGTAGIADAAVTTEKIASGVNLAAGTLSTTGNVTIGANGGATTLMVNNKSVPVAEENLRMVRGSISQISTTGETILIGNITTLTPVTRGTGWYLNGLTAVPSGHYRKVVFNPPFSDTPTITAATQTIPNQNPYGQHQPLIRNVTKDGFEVTTADGYYYSTTFYFAMFGFVSVDFIAVGPR